MEGELMDILSEKIPIVKSNPSIALEEYKKMKAHYLPLLSGFHTRAFLSFALGDTNLRRAVEELGTYKVPSSVCGAIINRYDIMWKCDTCSFVPNTCYCFSCFTTSLHEGHSYSFSLGVTGTCDCGDIHCANPETYCITHKHDPSQNSSIQPLNILPPYFQQATPFLIEDFIEDLHHCFCDLTMLNPANNDRKINDEINHALESLGVIMECHVSLIGVVSDCFAKPMKGHITKHRCIGMNAEEGQKEHECICTTIQLIVMNLAKIGVHQSLLLSYKEIAKKDSKFGKGFFEAFFAFYDEISANMEYRKKVEESLDDIPYQVTEYQDFVKDILKKYLPIYFQVMDSSITHYLADKDQNTSEIYYLCTDYMNLITHHYYNSNFLIEEMQFDEQYLKYAAKLQAADYKYGISHMKGNFFMAEIFMNKYIGYKITFPVNPPVKRILLAFKYAIEEDYGINNAIYAGTSEDKFFLDNLLYRLLGIFLNKLIIELYEAKAYSNIEEMRKILCELMGFQSLEELDCLLQKVLQPTLKVLTNACKYISGLFEKKLTEDQKDALELYYRRQTYLVYYDILTAQICISLMSEKANIYESILEPALGIQLGNAAQKETEEMCKYIESILHMLGQIMLNDYAKMHLYVKMGVRFANRKLTKENVELYKGCLSRELMLILMQEKYESENFKCLLLPEIISNLSFDLKCNTLEDELQAFFSVNAANTGYTLSRENLKSINMFNHSNILSLHSFEKNYENILSYLKIQSYDICDCLNNQLPAFQATEKATMNKLTESKLFSVLIKIIENPLKIYEGELTKLFR